MTATAAAIEYRFGRIGLPLKFAHAERPRREFMCASALLATIRSTTTTRASIAVVRVVADGRRRGGRSDKRSSRSPRPTTTSFSRFRRSSTRSGGTTGGVLSAYSSRRLGKPCERYSWIRTGLAGSLGCWESFRVGEKPLTSIPICTCWSRPEG